MLLYIVSHECLLKLQGNRQNGNEEWRIDTLLLIVLSFPLRTENVAHLKVYLSPVKCMMQSSHEYRATDLLYNDQGLQVNLMHSQYKECSIYVATMMSVSGVCKYLWI